MADGEVLVKFEGEDALDYAQDNYALQINPASGVNLEHLDYFKFIGRTTSSTVVYSMRTLCRVSATSSPTCFTRAPA
jgi:hypothetical protein